jgi:hypothetical protein
MDGLPLWRRRLTGKLRRLKFAQTKVNFLSGLIEHHGLMEVEEGGVEG